MASATVFVGPGDGFVRKFGGAYSGLYATGSVTGNDAGPTSTGDYMVETDSANPMIYRSFFPVDCSSGNTGIPAGSIVTAVDFFFYVTAKATGGGGSTANQSITIVQGTPASNTTLATTDYGNVGSTEWTGTRATISGLTTSAYNSISLNATGIAAFQTAVTAGSGYVVPAARIGYDIDQVAPTGGTVVNAQTKYSEQTGTSNDPYVVITYRLSKTTSDAWAWGADAAEVTGRSGNTTLGWERTSVGDSWAWSDAAAPSYWRANRTPILVREAGANTTLSGSHTFATGTTTVASTTGFPSSGTFVVSSAWVQTKITYTGKTGTTFTGCTGGTGTYGTGALVMASDSENHFPQVLTLDNTSTPQILVAYIQKPGHGGSYDCKIAGKKSTNGGLTWGSEFTITNFVNSTGYTGGGFVIQRLLTGRLLILWYEGDVGTGAAGLVKSYIAYSDDNFATLSTPVRLTSPFHVNVCAVGFDGYLYTGSGSNGTYGDFYVTCYGNDTSAYDNTITYNRLMKVTDGGAGGTWTSVGIINTMAQVDTRASEEASLTVLDDGTWVSHLRVEVTGGFPNLDRYQCTSTDLGVTWGGHTRIAQKVSNAAVSHQMPEGHMLTQGTNEDGTRGTSGRQITFISMDRGSSWPSTLWRLEETDATYAYGNGSDFFNVTDTSVPLRRVLNAYSQERFSQGGAQVKFQWYAVENLPLSSDTWTWSDAASRTTNIGKTTADSWAWTDTAVGGRSFARTASDTWAWTDIANPGASQGRITFGNTWAWSDTAVGTTAFARTAADAWAWSDTAANTHAAPSYYSRTTSDTWAWSERTTAPGTAFYWLRAARRRSMSAPTKTYVAVVPNGTTKTATYTSPTYEAKTEAGILVVLDVTAASGTGGLTVRINAHDQASSQAVALNAAPTAVTATGTTSYALYPFGAVAGNVTQATSFYLPRMFSISVTAGDSSSYTYSLGYCLLP